MGFIIVSEVVGYDIFVQPVSIEVVEVDGGSQQHLKGQIITILLRVQPRVALSVRAKPRLMIGNLKQFRCPHVAAVKLFGCMNARRGGVGV